MHKTWKLTLTGAAAAIAMTGAWSTAHAALCGDSDANGTIAINDVVLHLRAVTNQPGAQAAICGGAGYANCANLNGTGGVNDIVDTTLLLKRASKIANCPQDLCITPTPLAGCPGTAIIGTLQGDGTRQVTGNLVVPAGCDARLDKVTFVESGAVLTVAPGATIKGNVGDPPSTLVVKTGGRIDAVGNAGAPIVWTSAASVGTRNRQDWGGVAILGRAPVNEPGIELEGLPPDPELVYGGAQADDFSGCMSYNRIEFAGRALTPDNELNNFVMAGVGNKTRIDHIQAHFGADDCIEWFGGTVNSKFLVLSACGDDGLDTQLGVVGGVQFALVEQEANALEAAGSNGFEEDNSEFGATKTPFNNPKYCNVTALGAKYSAANPAVTNTFGILSRRGNAMTIANSIVKDFRQAGYTLRDAPTATHACTNSTTLNTVAPIGQIVNSLFNNNGSGGSVHAQDDASCPSGGACNCSATEHFALLTASKNTIGTTDASIAAIGGATFPRTNLVPAIGSLADTHPAANCTAIDSSFVDAPYIGAFEPGGADWTAGWTAFPFN
jgi:hypothetical protein